MSRSLLLLSLSLSLSLSACERDDEPSITARAQVANAPQLNGWQLNGWQMGAWGMGAWQMGAWRQGDLPLGDISLTGSLLTGTQQQGDARVPVSGHDFVGATLELLMDGEEFTLRIDDITLDPASPTADIYFYSVSVLDADEGAWTSLCVDALGQPTQAIALAGRWDPSGAHVDQPGAVTFACRGAVLAKCVEWGYRPWAHTKACDDGECAAVSLRAHHQACTRMTRADYCGDGVPHTLAGTPIDIYDGLPAPLQTAGTQGQSGWDIEAEWGPDGALCVGESLRLELLEQLEIPHETPSCLDALADTPTCGDLALPGAKIADRYCDAWHDDPAACRGVYELPDAVREAP